ncbi:hypothetical protein [Nonomuraea salmonea]|uniref:Uncharacterized protein n=1 Tax=Nonomuraea salmonea TaxID=46181 RepID=A0ABV5P1F0_9ACTN
MRRQITVRRAAGFAAAAAMCPYLLVKVSWIVQELARGTAEWVLLNAVTVVMALAGVGLGLAVAQPWGMRLPGRLVLPVVWVAGGLLVSMLPYVAAAALLVPSAPEPAVEPSSETALIGVAFTGMAVALVVGLPLYVRERWNRAFTGRVGSDAAGRRTRWLLPPVAALAALWAYWAAGGTAGLAQTPDLNARLLLANSALGAACAGWSLWALRRRSSRLWPPMTLGFITSGSLFSWAAWKLAWLLVPGLYQPVEHLWVALVEHVTAMATGLALLAVLVGTYRRRSAVDLKFG